VEGSGLLFGNANGTRGKTLNLPVGGGGGSLKSHLDRGGETDDTDVASGKGKKDGSGGGGGGKAGCLLPRGSGGCGEPGLVEKGQHLGWAGGTVATPDASTEPCDSDLENVAKEEGGGLGGGGRGPGIGGGKGRTMYTVLPGLAMLSEP
jgi:hypothetical protein